MTPVSTASSVIASNARSPREHSSAQAIRALVSIHLSRIYKSVFGAFVVVVVLCGLSVAKHGWSVDSLLPFIFGGAAALPALPPFSLVREKFDGSLRYFASLPISGSTHAMARLIVTAIACLPGAIAAGIAAHIKLSTPLAAAVALGLCAFVFMCSAALALLAFQIKAKVGHAMSYLMYCFLALVALTNAAKFAATRGWFAPLRPILFTPAGLATASLVIWIGFLAVGLFGFRSIGKGMMSYRGEPPEV